MSGDDEDSGEYWDVGASKSFNEVYGKIHGSQHELSDFTYPEPDRIPEPYTSPVPALIERYIDYLDLRLASGQDFQKAVSETPLPDHAFQDQIQRVRSRTLDFETAMRVVMFIEATGMSASDFASKSEYGWFRQMLGMDNHISHPTPGNAKSRRFDFELRRFLRQFTDEAIRAGHTHGTHWKFIAEHPDREFDGGGQTTISVDDERERSMRVRLPRYRPPVTHYSGSGCDPPSETETGTIQVASSSNTFTETTNRSGVTVSRAVGETPSSS